MPLSDLLQDLRQLEKTAAAQHGSLILDAFRRHTSFGIGAVYLREGSEMRLVAKSDDCRAPERINPLVPPDVSTATPLPIDPVPQVVLPIRNARDGVGVVALRKSGDGVSEDELEMMRTAGAFLSAVVANHRLLQETREGDFQLKYRLWELESLYDIGLSIAATLNIEELADEILFRMISLTNARRAALVLRDGGIGAFEANELRLLSLFASQVAIALENARLHREALEKQAMERELELAATIQRDILPKAIPEVEGIEIATLSRPAKQVGGDYHAFFVRDGVLTMLVGDVAGKSMPAALLVSALHAATQLLFAEGRDLGDIATELNRHIHNWSAENKFVTMVIVSIDRENETIEFVNAGHNPAYIVRDGKLDQIRSHGLPIGILPTTRYATQHRPFPPGSSVVLYSDGITEAEDVGGEEFENARLEQILAGCTNAGLLRDDIAKAVDGFTAGAPQKDDQTLVIARLLASEVG